MSDTKCGLSGEPMRESAGAMTLVTRAAKAGATDARETATKVWNGTSRFVSRFVYTTSYTLSYGVVFPAMLVARAIPKDNVIMRGIVEGAHAATEKVEELQTPKTRLIIPSHA
jgi:hypothetical protein